MSFGEQLKCRRKELGLSRSELAKQLGVSQSAVGNYETGVSAPKEEILLRIFDALHVEPNYLYRGSFESAGGDASPEERTLVEKYRALSPAGRQTIHTLLDALCRMQGEPARTIPLYRSPAAAGAAAPVPGLDYELLTVTGDAIKEPKNLLVPLGTSFQQIIDEGKGFKEEPDRVLTGGPMMGIAQYNLDVTCIKGTNAVLCLTKKEAAPVVEEEVCLRCGRCVNVCPMHLTPVYMHLYAEKGMWKEAEALNVMDCIECGSCNYICPARLHLVQSFRVTKGELRALAAKEKAAKEAAKA